MSAWQPISTAPKDGTIIRLRNSAMTSMLFINGHWGRFKSQVTGKVYTDWCSDITPDENFIPFPAGALVVPDEWQPIPAEAAE